MNHRRVIVVISLALAAGCGGSSLPSAPSPGPTGTVDSSAGIHAAALDRGSLNAATLDVSSGITTLDVKAADTAGKLVTAATPATSGQQPVLAMSSTNVADLQFTDSGTGTGPATATVALNPSVAWTIDLDGGATEESVDMRSGHLIALDLAAGTTRATVNLPARSGTQAIRENGGAQLLTVTVPASVALKVSVQGGASSVQLRGVTHTGIGGVQHFTDPGYATAGQRLDVALIGGISQLQVRSP